MLEIQKLAGSIFVDADFFVRSDLTSSSFERFGLSLEKRQKMKKTNRFFVPLFFFLRSTIGGEAAEQHLEEEEEEESLVGQVGHQRVVT